MLLTNEPFFWEGSPERACLLLHGLGGGVYELCLIGQQLRQQGWTVQAITYPGHEQTTAQMPSSRWEDWFESIRTTYDQLAQRYATVSVVGFSTGCPLSLWLATQVPLGQLVLLSPFIAIRHHWYYGFTPESYLHTLGQWLASVPRLGPQVKDPVMAQEILAVTKFRTFNLAAARSALALIAQVKPVLGQVTCPTLIIQSSEDSVVAPWGATFIHERLGSQAKSLHWLRQSDHVITLDFEREQVLEQVVKFLS